jgi:hypothetical protein
LSIAGDPAHGMEWLGRDPSGEWQPVTVAQLCRMLPPDHLDVDELPAALRPVLIRIYAGVLDFGGEQHAVRIAQLPAQPSAEPASAPDLPVIRSDPRSSAAVEEPSLSHAKPSEIRAVLDELYDEAIITRGFKPPSPREAGQRGKRLLAERGRYAAASQIEALARKRPYAEVHLKRGEHFKH